MYQNQIKTKLLLSTASLVVSLAAPVVASAQETAPATAAAETPDKPDDKLEEVTVTGTSIRGAPPIGSNLISLGREDIEKTGSQTLQQVLKSIPAVTGLGSVTQGGYSSNDSAGAYAPTIHGLGGVNSNSTLVLIDGHRFPLGAVGGGIADPNFLPANALERVEVLPDGASSIYGSDAVAGVINFITRRHFSGVEVTGQTGYGDGYRTSDAGMTLGKTWDTGFAFLAYNFSDRSAIPQADRPFTYPDQIPRGGTNFDTFYCGPASIQPTGSNLVYKSPYTGPGVPSSPNNAFCNSVASTDLIPAERKQSVMLKYEEEVNERLTLAGDAVYSTRSNYQDISRGSVTAVVYGPGSGKGGQINPFYVAPAGSTATSETVYLNADNLLGPGADARSNVETYYATGRAEYKLAADWRVTASLLTGANTSTTTTYNALCVSCALLDLNGTTNSRGLTTQPSIPGTSTTVLNLPLTTANALDPFNPAGANQTSAATLAGLVDPASYNSSRQSIEQYDLKLDGTALHLPAGELRIAAGAEYLYYDMRPQLVQTLNIGPITQGALTSLNLHYERDVTSGYLEAYIPVLSPEMSLPLVRKFDIDLSGRYDHYSDFGSTSNPKFAFNWEVVNGLKLRGNIARSFVAPPIGAIGQNGIASYDSFGTFLGPFSVPLDRYPQAKLIPACANATTVCTFNTTAVPGVVIQGANPNLQAQTGKTWSIGADFAPLVAPDLTTSVTFWHNELNGGVTSPIPALALTSTGFASLLQIYPAGATAAQLDAARGGRPQTTVLPPTVYWTYNFVGQNALNLTVEGIDADVRYGHKFGWGSISGGVAGTYKTRFDQQVGAGSPTFSVLNREGYNSTFPSLQFAMRADLGVTVGRTSLTAFLNHTGGFTYWGGTAVNPVITAGGVPVGGGDKVKPYNTVDLHLSYDFAGFLPGSIQAFLDVTNLFNTDPPFENNQSAANNSAAITGYDPFSASPIGRVVTVGVRARF